MAGLEVTLYPAPDNSFYFNFRPFITALINTRNFEDTLETGLQSPVIESFIYDFTEGIFLQKKVDIKITLEDNSMDEETFVLEWIAGVEQISDYTNFRKADTLILSPFKKQAANNYYLKYWQGYPFDFPLYFRESTLTFKNITNLLNCTFSMEGIINRIFLSDGRTDETLEDLLPLVPGHNLIRLVTAAGELPSDKFITLEKVPYKCGAYLKWLNKYGGYSYWLFEDTYAVDRSTKQLGELNRDNANLEDSFGRSIQIGKESQDTMKLVAELLTPDERNIVEGLLDSPKIYLFTGVPYSQNSYRNWVEVTLKTTGARIKNPKQALTNFSFDIELPARYTQTL